MNSKRIIGLLGIFILFLNSTIFAFGAPTSQIIDIFETADDGFNTEVGIGIDSTLVTILDPAMSIRAYLVFENLEINSWELLTNATLRLTSASTLPFDADSSITIHGMKQSDLGNRLTERTLLSPSDVQSMPLTTALVNVNTSQFFGGAILEIDVTAIMQELKDDPHWDGHGLSGTLDGDDIGFILLGAPDETRYFYDFRGDPLRAAELEIHWGHLPPTPPGGVFNETNRGFNIFVVDHNGLNRTGIGADLNWNTVNMTELTEQDSGADLTLQNDTWVTFTSITKSSIDSMYNDSGAAGISTFFARFYINTTAVTNSIAGNDPVTSLVGLSTVIPTGAGGLAYGVAGDWVGLVVILNADDQRWRIFARDRSGAADSVGGASTNFWEDWPDLLYFEVLINQTAGFIAYSIYNDAAYTDLNQTRDYTIVNAAGPYRYPQLIASVGQAGGSSHTGEFYTFLVNPLADNSTWIVTDENGTILNECPTYDCAIIFIDDLLGPDPVDPDPPSQGWDVFGPFSRFKTRFYILLIGLFLVFGPLFSFALNRPSGYEFTIGAFLMLVGFALMIAAGSV